MAEQDIRENAMGGGTPKRLRGLAANGDSISPTLEEVMNAMGINRYVYELIDGQEVSLETTDSGLYVVHVSYYAHIALYVIGSYARNAIITPDSNFFGSFNANTNLSILFGRKENNGVLYIRNNSGQKLTAIIKKIAI